MSTTYIPSTRHLTFNNLVTKIKIEYILMKKSTPDRSKRLICTRACVATYEYQLHIRIVLAPLLRTRKQNNMLWRYYSRKGLPPESFLGNAVYV